MGPQVYLEQYRISTAADGIPMEMARNGPAITYKASDLKSGAPVALTLIPTVSIDPAERDQFEEKARTAMLLDHAHIAKTVAFGATDDSLVFVSEYPQGETVEAWVTVHGPMPPDAVLRIALQVVAALGAASFHGLHHPAIQPANLVIVTGKTAEGGWPFVKLTHFALSGLKSAPGYGGPDVSASDFASPEQLLQGKIDFRSEIYSLGATMCFLLTGVFYSAYPRSPQTKRFARPLRTLIARTLDDDPNARPQDPVLFAEEVRNCLASIERREGLKRKYGIPFAPIVTKPRRWRRARQPRPVPLLASLGPTTPAADEKPKLRPSRWRPAWAIVGALLVLGIVGALLLPEDIVTAALHRKKPVESIGVPVGVPDSSPPTVAHTNAGSPAPAAVTIPDKSKIAASGNSTQIAKPPAEGPASPSTAAMTSTPEPAPLTSTGFVAQQAPIPTDQKTAPLKNEPAVDTEARTESTAGVAAAGSPASKPDREIATSNPEIAAAAVAPPTVASNNIAREPAPPAEAPEQSGDAQTQSSEPNHDSADIAAKSGDTASQSQPEAHKPETSSESPEVQSHTRKPATVTQSKTRTSKSRVPRALPVEPDSQPSRGGLFHARVVGITPAGNVILALPNGERAIVSPQDAEQYSHGETGHRRPRRVIIERRIFVPQQQPQPPYQPFIPPDD